MTTVPARKPPPRRVPLDEVHRRMEFVETQLAAHVSFGQVRAKFAAKFKASTRTAERYIHRVHQRWAAETTAEERALARVILENSAKHAYRIALRNSDPRGMIVALDFMAKLYGLFDHSIDVRHSGDISVVFEGPSDGPHAREFVPVEGADNGTVEQLEG